MTKRYRDGECCGGCGHAGLTLDREGLCHGCWQAERDHEEAERELYGVELTVGTERALDGGYEVPLPLSVLRARAVPVGPLCEVPFGLTAAVYVAKRPAARGLFDFLRLDGYTVGRV